jgi:hypothetical protein
MTPHLSPQPTGPQKAFKPSQVTIGYDHYRPLKGQWLTRVVPALKLGGQWLAEAGFAVGAKAEVIAADGELVIRVIPPEPEPEPIPAPRRRSRKSA